MSSINLRTFILTLRHWWPRFIGRGRMSKEKQSLSWPSRSLWNTFYFHLKHDSTQCFFIIWDTGGPGVDQSGGWCRPSQPQDYMTEFSLMTCKKTCKEEWQHLLTSFVVVLLWLLLNSKSQQHRHPMWLLLCMTCSQLDKCLWNHKTLWSWFFQLNFTGRGDTCHSHYMVFCFVWGSWWWIYFS